MPFSLGSRYLTLLSPFLFIFFLFFFFVFFFLVFFFVFVVVVVVVVVAIFGMEECISYQGF